MVKSGLFRLTSNEGTDGHRYVSVRHNAREGWPPARLNLWAVAEPATSARDKKGDIMSTSGELLVGMDVYGLYIIESVVKKIGRPRFYLFGRNLNVKFSVLVRRALADLRSKPIGKRLVETISGMLKEKHKTIRIEIAGGQSGQGGSGWDREDYLLRWNPVGFGKNQDDDQLGGIPACVILGHELIHALHTLEGNDQLGKNSSDYKAIDEARTIGLGTWKDSAMSENGLRRERKLKKRTTFCMVKASRFLKGTGYV